MLRRTLLPFDAYLADALSMADADFCAAHPWPMLVIPEPGPEVMSRIRAVETIVDTPADMVQVDATRSARMQGASLDALCLEVRPKASSSTDRMTIGRAPSSDVVLLDESISRTHAELAWDATAGSARVTDVGGRNGTLVNGIRLTEGVPTNLESGAVIVFGAVKCRYYSPSDFFAWLTRGAPRAGATTWAMAAAHRVRSFTAACDSSRRRRGRRD